LDRAITARSVDGAAFLAMKADEIAVWFTVGRRSAHR
jgi:hypothetical protein